MVWDARRIIATMWVCAISITAAILPAQSRAQDMPAAQIDHGKRLFLYCAACHSLGASESDKTGPNLHGVIGSAAGTRGTFSYSSALKASGIIWTPETLDRWLKQPASLVLGTKMAFAGLSKDQDRADVIGYLLLATK